MKTKRISAWILTIAMLVTFIPSFTLTASAAPTTSVTVAGTKLSDTGYYGVSSLSIKSDVAPTNDVNGYVYWDSSTGTLTLHEVTVGGNGIRCSERADLTIVLDDGTTNNVTTTTGSAVVSETGSIRIMGRGTLNANGVANGIWCMYTVSVTDGATLNAVGNNGMGIVNKPNTFNDGVIIDASAAATIIGNTYGIGCEWSITRAPIINSPNVTVKGLTAAFQTVPTLGADVGAMASTSIDGANPETYNSSSNSSYKWFQSKTAQYEGNTPVDDLMYKEEDNTLIVSSSEAGTFDVIFTNGNGNVSVNEVTFTEPGEKVLLLPTDFIPTKAFYWNSLESMTSKADSVEIR